MAETARYGRQTPTASIVIPYEKTLGPKAIKLYNITKRRALEWQEQLLYDILAVNENGLWTHTKYGYSVPRRNGKSEILEMREFFGLLRGEKILHTAHRTTTSHSTWERLCSLLAEAGLVEGADYKTTKQMGLEQVRMLGTGGRIAFRTRSHSGGLGEGYDLLIIDEAQEYTDAQKTALKYVVSDSKNPQTIYCGTPPTAVSAGTVFMKLRKDALRGLAENAGWAEWSVEMGADVNDKNLWYETNPSLGYILSERSIIDELDDDTTDFEIQRLGVWIKYNQKSEYGEALWNALKPDTLPSLDKNTFVGIKFGPDGQNVTMSVAVKTKDDRVFVEGVDCRPIKAGYDWIYEYLGAMKPKSIVIDGASGQKALYDELKTRKVKNGEMPSLGDVIEAYTNFEQAMYNKTMIHSGQESLTQAITNCEKRAIGTKGGFGFKTLREGIEVGLIESAALAYNAAYKYKEKKPQKIIA